MIPSFTQRYAYMNCLSFVKLVNKNKRIAVSRLYNPLIFLQSFILLIHHIKKHTFLYQNGQDG